MKQDSMVVLAVCSLLVLMVVPTQAAGPPNRVNYQGVLRDSAGAPLDGVFPMDFRFYDTPTAGNQLLLNTPAVVTVTGGLFNVELGSGSVSDGSGPGVYLSLIEMFSDFSEVWMEIFVSGEMLSPRVAIVAAPFALNAGRLDGRSSAEFLDTSPGAQTKAGDLSLDDLNVGGRITISGGLPGTGKVLTSDASGLASWIDPPVGSQQLLLSDLADRLQTSDPQDLPFASLGSFDCTGASTATMSFALDGIVTGEVNGFVGRDSISKTFEYLVSIKSSTAIAAAAQIGKVGRLTVTRTTGTTTFSGRITEFGLAGLAGGKWTYVVRIEPKLTDLGRSSGYGVYQSFSVPNIIAAELSSFGVTNFALSFAGSLPTKEFTLQYNESSFDFLRRLAEQDGVHYHFEEVAAEEQVIWSDTNSAFPLIPGGFTYDGDMANPGGGVEFVSTFHERDRQHTGSGTVRAYDFTSAGPLIDETAVAGSGIGEQYEFFAAAVGTARAVEWAQLLVDREQVRRFAHSGTSNAAGFKAGHKFALTDTTAAGFGGTYIVTDITHFAVASDPSCIEYGNVFTAIPDTTTYRPPRVTPIPVVSGPMTAEVTGPAGGGQTYTDSYGRIKVQFHWDRVGAHDETSSGWIRVATPAGRTDDRRWVPEVGTEVVIDFLQGDPDRPIVIGSVYNGGDLPPAADTLVLDGGEIRMDRDSEGDQTIYFYDSGIATGEYLRWDDSLDRFDFSDDLRVTNNLTVSGEIRLGSGGTRLIGSSTTTLQALGDSNTDDILLYAGNTLDDGALRILGDSTFESRSGSGLFTFVNGATSVERARIDALGNAQFDGDLTVSGSDLLLGFGAGLGANSAGLTLAAGDADTDDLILRAGNSTDDGEIAIFGDSTMSLRAGNGLFQIVAADTNLLMTLNQTGATLNEWKFGGANLVLFLGDSGADDVFVPGSFSVTGTKNFVQNHPQRADLSVVYTALEGDEAGTYTRGSATLVDGEARIRLGETFAWVTSPDIGLTAHVTPRSEWAELYVASISSTELVVRARSGSDTEAAFDYIVHGLRIGYEDFSVLQPRRMDGALPARETVESYYETNVGLRRYNALERFRRMDPQTRRAQPVESAAVSLRTAIGERRPDVEGDPSELVDAPSIEARGSAAVAGDRGESRAEMVDISRPTVIEPVAALPLGERGDVHARSFRTGDSELAAFVPVSDGVELGDVVVVDRDDPAQMRPATRRGDPAVVGVVSGRPGLLLGGADVRAVESDEHIRRPHAPVAFSGITIVKVDAGYGAIAVGDLLTSSPTAGHAMRADDPAPGTIVGKALEPLDAGTGLVRVLVMLR